eukprot:TRINITY_DN3110_c0_g1_i11.p2 TRINITY_DN3110_c0_g1~~TRINITY_DN3110_c0_g1_i11.p2  ORF type:complete len:220 (+),score=-18.27 TRINITY_DN3110_c0_g1_i11:497-1156(+)
MQSDLQNKKMKQVRQNQNQILQQILRVDKYLQLPLNLSYNYQQCKTLCKNSKHLTCFIKLRVSKTFQNYSEAPKNFGAFQNLGYIQVKYYFNIIYNILRYTDKWEQKFKTYVYKNPQKTHQYFINKIITETKMQRTPQGVTQHQWVFYIITALAQKSRCLELSQQLIQKFLYFSTHTPNKHLQIWQYLTYLNYLVMILKLMPLYQIKLYLQYNLCSKIR